MAKGTNLSAEFLNVEPVALPGQQDFGDSVFPFILKCTEPAASLAQVADWVGANHGELQRLATWHGAVFFRDFPLATAEDFDAFIAGFGLTNYPYLDSLSNAVRVNRTERVFSANEAPPEVNILFHHEMAQTPTFPRMLFFFCEIAPTAGGATPVCRSDILVDRLSERCPDFVKKCEETGLKYSNVMPEDDDPTSGMGRSWRSTLKVSTREEAEQKLRDIHYTWTWLDDGCLRMTTPILPGIREVSPGRKTFFNQLIAAFCGWKDSRNNPADAIRHGDDEKLDADAVMQAVAIADELAFDIPWQSGDAVLVDNTIAMHGRRPYVGSRKVLASLVEPESQSTAIR